MKNSDEKLRIRGLQRQEIEGSDANADTTGLQGLWSLPLSVLPNFLYTLLLSL